MGKLALDAEEHGANSNTEYKKHKKESSLHRLSDKADPSSDKLDPLGKLDQFP